MIALDACILVYSVRQDSPWHRPALKVVRSLAEGPAEWAIPWPCIHEFLAIATHPNIYQPPMPMLDALRQVEYWMDSPGLRLLSETQNYWSHLSYVAGQSRITGPAIHDARVAALCRSAGVTELWTADRDFSRFPGLVTRNPLLI